MRRIAPPTAALRVPLGVAAETEHDLAVALVEHAADRSAARLAGAPHDPLAAVGNEFTDDELERFGLGPRGEAAAVDHDLAEQASLLAVGADRRNVCDGLDRSRRSRRCRVAGSCRRAGRATRRSGSRRWRLHCGAVRRRCRRSCLVGRCRTGRAGFVRSSGAACARGEADATVRRRRRSRRRLCRPEPTGCVSTSVWGGVVDQNGRRSRRTNGADGAAGGEASVRSTHDARGRPAAGDPLPGPGAGVGVQDEGVRAGARRGALDRPRRARAACRRTTRSPTSTASARRPPR